MTTLARVLGDPPLLRRIAYAAAGAAALVSMVTSFFYKSEGDAIWVVPLVPLVVLTSLPEPRIRATVLGLGAGFIALWTPDFVFLWPAVSALTLVSIAEDRAAVPVVGWVTGLVGSVGSLVLAPEQATVASFLAVALGGSLGLLLRYRLQTNELTEQAGRLTKQAGRLTEQARWLEQRTVLARELHDVVGHHVTAMVVQAEAGLVSDPQKSLTSIGELGRTALTELDALVVHLRDPDAPLVLSAPPRLSDIDELLAAPLRQQGVVVTVTVDPDLVLDEVLTLAAYRITQETLTNVSRHSGATAAWVEVVPFSGRLRLRVTDDGVGPPAEITRGSGLLGIEERVRAADGMWAMSERPGGGTVVDVFLPLSLTSGPRPAGQR